MAATTKAIQPTRLFTSLYCFMKSISFVNVQLAAKILNINEREPMCLLFSVIFWFSHTLRKGYSFYWWKFYLSMNFVVMVVRGRLSIYESVISTDNRLVFSLSLVVSYKYDNQWQPILPLVIIGIYWKSVSLIYTDNHDNDFLTFFLFLVVWMM